MRKVLILIIMSFYSVITSANETKEPQAFEWATALTIEAIHNAKGGVAKGTKGLANLDATLTIDTSSAGWWNGGTWFVYALGNYGKNPSTLSGDLQTLSNITTDDAAKIYEFWYQHSFANDSIKLLIGLHDYNSTFYSLDSAGLFTLSSFGIGADTAQVSPSIFSTTSTALHLTLQQDNYYLLLAVYDGVPGDPNNPKGTHIQFNKGDGLFKAIETGITENDSYKFAVGAWQKTTQEDNAVNGLPINNNQGFYIIGEKYLTENLIGFFQYGHADANKNQLDEYGGIGLRLNNAIKENDAFGLGVARANNGLPFLQENPELEEAETIWELTYYQPLVEHINMQTSAYYIANPSMLPELTNAVALGVRFYIEF